MDRFDKGVLTILIIVLGGLINLFAFHEREMMVTEEQEIKELETFEVCVKLVPPVCIEFECVRNRMVCVERSFFGSCIEFIEECASHECARFRNETCENRQKWNRRLVNVTYPINLTVFEEMAWNRKNG